MPRKHFRKTETARVLLEGTIVALTADALLLKQEFCRCGINPENCRCPEVKMWIPKALARRSSLFDAKKIGNYTLWEKGAAKVSVPLSFFNQKKSQIVGN